VSATIQLARRDQADVFAALQLGAALAGYAAIFPDDAPPPTLDELAEQWRFSLGPDWEAGRRAFVAREDGTTVGIVLVGADPMDPCLGHMARLYVVPERWGRGTGTALYEAALHHLRQVGFEQATLWVLERNTLARSWYERLGWECTGERKPVWPPAGIEDVRYRLSL
jgi:GNAT superfamily N-acetyltransferase